MDTSVVPFTDSAPISVVNGFQGGMWVMPTLVATGIGPAGHVTGTIELLDGTPVGSNAFDVRLEPDPSGAWLLRRLPIPVGAAQGSPPVRQLDDVPARLTITCADTCENSASYVQTLRLHIEGVTP